MPSVSGWALQVGIASIVASLRFKVSMPSVSGWALQAQLP